MKARSHSLKTWPAYFDATASGAKPFEVRQNDRDFRVGDLLILRRFDPERQEYTGALLKRKVSYLLLGGAFGVAEGTVILGLGKLLIAKKKTARLAQAPSHCGSLDGRER